MSSKLTELAESSPSALPQSVLCGSVVFSQLSSPSMASSGHFDPSQIYDGYREVGILDPACTECWAKGKDCFQHYNPRYSKCHYCFIGKKPCPCSRMLSSNIRRYLWSRKEGPFGKELPASEAPNPDGNSVFSQYAEGSDELNGAEVVVVPHSVGHPSSNSSFQPLANRFQNQVIPSTPRTFQPVLASIPTTIPPSSPNTYHARPALNPAVIPSPSQKPRN
ncbi:hypothetical protein O181_037432 [Austropuccinia psidii MF-1]|uniref:Uncharacterized protein n=1 Tax=Austropuccinia psidii MF-1 TaxID=1389203 RepID=A0A9Q3DCP1_9BASI|nr:hypothetical protein [Austropuccinia psidii MF-1]